MRRRPSVIVALHEQCGCRTLARELEMRGYDAAAAAPIELEARLARGATDAAILEMAGPGGGLALLRAALTAGVPVVALAVAVEDAVLVLELGAADVLTGAVEPRELVARLDRLMARAGRFHRRVLRFETATADLTAARVFHDDGRSVGLSAGEVALLSALMAAGGASLSAEEIAGTAPAGDPDAGPRAVATRIARLRRKLETGRIELRRGAGYVLVEG